MTLKQLGQVFGLFYSDNHGPDEWPALQAPPLGPHDGVHTAGADCFTLGVGPYLYELEEDETISPIAGPVGQGGAEHPVDCACVMMTKYIAGGQFH